MPPAVGLVDRAFMTGGSLVSRSVSALGRLVSAVVEDVGEIWSNRKAARHIGRMTVDLGLRRGATDSRSSRPASGPTSAEPPSDS